VLLDKDMMEALQHPILGATLAVAVAVLVRRESPEIQLL
jgi:hypothetical protein